MAKKTATVNVGIDVGKSQLDLYIHERELHLLFPNTYEGINKCLSRLGHYQSTRIVVEATGHRSACQNR